MFNQFTGIGNMAADPDQRFAQSGTAIANFTLCCDHGWGDNKKTEFVRCVAFGKLAELVGNYLSKGSKAMIQGAMQTRSWEDKDGNKRYTTEIVVSEVKFLSPKGSGSSNHQEEQPPLPEPSTGGDAPF